MRIAIAVLAVAPAALALCASSAPADHRPVIAVTGNGQVPVIIDGIDATGHVVIGDWGLHRPGAVAPAIFNGSLLTAAPPAGRRYFPATGRRPAYGRQEIEPSPRIALPPAPTFHRFWSTEPAARAPGAHPPYDPPPVIEAPPPAGDVVVRPRWRNAAKKRHVPVNRYRPHKKPPS